MDASCQLGQLRCVFAVEGDVQPLCRHVLIVHATTRHVHAQQERLSPYGDAIQTADNCTGYARG
jgi:hypothetical protein